MDLNYELIGNGKRSIVLLHYFGGNANSWNWVVQKLKKRFSIVLITLPGFGGTNPLNENSIFAFAKYINSCIEKLQLSDYILCGHSMGAKLILYADQIRLSNKAKGLILIAPSPPTGEKVPEENKKKLLPPPQEELARSNVRNTTVRKLKGKRLSTAIESQLQTHPTTWRWWLTEGMQNDISDRIKGIDTPTFVICAKKDPVIKMDVIYNEVLPNLHNPRLVQLGRCGHLIPLEAPRKLSRRIRKVANALLV